MDALPRRFGPFLLLKSLGSGATGDVFLARPLDRSRGWPSPLVVKRMFAAMTSHPEQQARFHHEALLGRALSTPHVPRVHDVDVAEGTPYIAMDYVPGWTLSRIMKGGRQKQTSAASIIDVVRGILKGLIAVHTARDPSSGRPLGALHRDLAPKNVMLGEDGVTRLIDFGLGKSTVQDWQTSTGVIMGTPGYMAPEQVLASAMDVRTDLYAVGVVFWELLAGEPLVSRGPVHRMLREQITTVFRPLPARRTDAPAQCDAILEVALAVDMTDRFASAQEFLDAVDRLVDDLPSSPGPVGELIGTKLWDELAASQDELQDLTQAIDPAAEIAAAQADDEDYDDEEEPTTAGTPPDEATVGRPALGGPDDEDATVGGVAILEAPAAADLMPPPSVAAVTPAPVSPPAARAPVVPDPAESEAPTARDVIARAAIDRAVDANRGRSSVSGFGRPPKDGRPLMLGLAVASVIAALALGVVLAYRVLDEEPAPAIQQAPAAPVVTPSK